MMLGVASQRHPYWLALSALIYALFVFVAPITEGGNWQVWTLTFGSLALFAFVYFSFLRHRHRSFNRALLELILMAVLGFAMLPLNVGAATYIVYAAALAPLLFSVRQSVVFLVVIGGAFALAIAFHSSPDRMLIGAWVVALILVVGLGNIFFAEWERQNVRLRQSREEVEELAKLAERERIARDLHDLLGHTLSVIVLKAELASKLAENNPTRAAQEIREVERVSREALSEVRVAVEGYRHRGFAGELENARQTLQLVGVETDLDIGSAPWTPQQEAVLALALREAVTNVVKHAQASICSVRLGVVGDEIVLTVRDDGVGGSLREGSGLTGMRERTTAAGGSLDLESSRGVTVLVRFPVGDAPAAS